MSPKFDGEKSFTVENGKRIDTPLLMVTALVGLTDVVFAVDSIPAIFAILGLRATYFLAMTMWLSVKAAPKLARSSRRAD